MKLNATQLEKIAHNVVSCSFDEKGSLHFNRFTQQQKDIYEKESADWAAKTRASASATFDFITDSDYITLKFDLYPGSSQKYGSIDLYVDGVFLDSRVAEDLSIKLAGFQLPEGEHRVTIYFPWSAETVINEVHLSENASVFPVEKRCKLMCFGDSITQGYIAKYPSLSYVNRVARALDAEVINQGIGGYVFNEAAIDETILSCKPDIITVAYGTNDYSRYETAEEYNAHTGAYIQKLGTLFPDTPIVGILPIYRNDENHNARKLYRTYSLDDARACLRKHYEALPNGYVVEETGIAHLSDFYAADFLHPNDLGFGLMAQGVIRKLQAILNKNN